ncbi:hypothetical protein HK099_001403 [Clydaea vesicula]|uniref:Uncharacterized protein n=1 Tax=Clydaea vesicula TaxID=447962 RepID=A0AAD5XX05_9FUNG|nr:hypothetical protein HK099_001403 [Clydaea vesicula]
MLMLCENDLSWFPLYCSMSLQDRPNQLKMPDFKEDLSIRSFREGGLGNIGNTSNLTDYRLDEIDSKIEKLLASVTELKENKELEHLKTEFRELDLDLK